jgi:allantoinase
MSESRQHPPPLDLALRSTRVVHRGGCTPATVIVRDGLIAEILPHASALARVRLVDCKDSVIMPGLVDPHVHINDPGRSDWEGFRSATHAAASGGVTTIVDMPLNSIPATTTLAGIEAKRDAARGQCWCNVHLWGGVVPGNSAELEPMWRAGVLGFKCFLVPSGVDEFPGVTERDLREAMPALKRLGAPLLVHAELPGPIEIAEAAARGADGPDPAPTRLQSGQLGMPYSRYLATRPRQAEQEAIELMIRLCREYGTRVHIVHLASADAVPALREARAEGLPITVETCPHYLNFCAEEIPDGATHFKCAPPIRERENRERLWRAVAERVVDFVASDHSPCPAELKEVVSGDFLRAWGGVASLGLTLSVFWTAARTRRYTPVHVSELLSRIPAEFCGLGETTGRIAEGYTADIVVWNPDDQRSWSGYHRMTPYACAILYGVVEQTYLRGKLIFDHGEVGAQPEGHCALRRSQFSR